jgi:hypothetical protein
VGEKTWIEWIDSIARTVGLISGSGSSRHGPTAVRSRSHVGAQCQLWSGFAPRAFDSTCLLLLRIDPLVHESGAQDHVSGQAQLRLDEHALRLIAVRDMPWRVRIGITYFQPFCPCMGALHG